MSSGFEGVVALVTGGGSGIGRATAAALLTAGARVAVIDREVSHVPEGALPLEADVTDQTAVDDAVAQVIEHCQQLDVLVNNVGVSFVGTVEDGAMDDWHRVFDVNVFGHVRCTRAALPHLRRSSCAAIVNVGSCTVDTGLPNRALYTASKGAVHALTLAMAVDLLGDGIRVNAVVPGTVDTELIRGVAQRSADPVGTLARLHARQPTGRMVTAEEVAAAVVFLAQPGNGSAVGTFLTVDGGMATLMPSA